ncbi:hypothetical protein GQE99_11835 [Maritimibacter sp. DP07]|uniref:UDP-N-acetylenolpyruvoylglucosamine reductase n=1 Tax=Maritimibacter harenae TaxID=2606218 RepID=A0A845M2C0_9RHOB|nr:hypothetical protein [Maritimibacter harenae]MZR13706.1 hypothetical protein [Maritimibacter harenae]
MGLKGHRIGGAGFSDKNALVLVNHGAARHKDFAALPSLAKERVGARFGLGIAQEPVAMGDAL